MLSNIDFGSYFHTKKYEKGLSTGGDKIADWGGSKGGWGGHVPPSLYVKRGPANDPNIVVKTTHVKTHKLFQVCKQVVTNLFTSCRQVVFALLVPSC